MIGRYRVVILRRGVRPMYAEPGGPRPETGGPPPIRFKAWPSPAGLFAGKEAHAIARRLRPWPGRRIKVERYVEAPAARNVTGEAA